MLCSNCNQSAEGLTDDGLCPDCHLEVEASDERKNHLFSRYTDQCVYCGKSAADDCIENTPCERPCLADQSTAVPCDACGGKGWLLANDSNNGPRIERCDTCQRYESDQAALEALVNAAEHESRLLAFARNVSLLMHEGELDEMGEPHEPVSEEAIATLNQLIADARQLLGTSEKCIECGQMVPYVIGCPDGGDVCQDCFDAGKH